LLKREGVNNPLPEPKSPPPVPVDAPLKIDEVGAALLFASPGLVSVEVWRGLLLNKLKFGVGVGWAVKMLGTACVSVPFVFVVPEEGAVLLLLLFRKEKVC
jgi:hypothetical protein